MKYIYGPIHSRRLGLSLGLSVTPFKICDFDCLYCQLGRTKNFTLERKEYVRHTDLLDELRSWLQGNEGEAGRLGYITVSGLGEPTLNSSIGQLIAGVKKMTSVPVAVITNASLINNPRVRSDILQADLIAPSLDAVVPEVFSKIDRPHQEIKVEEIVNGLISLRKEFHGAIWIEVMLVKGANDDLRHIRKMKEAIEKINPDKIQINSPVRASAQADVSSVDKYKLKKVKEILGERCEIL